MDSTTAHLLAKIDLLRETQRDHGELLRQLLASQASTQSRSPPVESTPKPVGTGPLSRLMKLPLHWQWIAGGVVSWGISASIGSYLNHGGDPVKVIELLLKFFA